MDYIHVQCKNLIFCPATILVKKMQMHFIVLEDIYLFKDKNQQHCMTFMQRHIYFHFFLGGEKPQYFAKVDEHSSQRMI